MRRSDAPEGLRSGELARRAGISVDTLRVYEKRGLLAAPGRTRNGYRLYRPEALERVLTIQRALAFGFTLAELTQFLGTRASGTAPCRDVRDAAEQRLSEIRASITELAEFESSLARLLTDWDASLAARPKARRHRFLEALPTSPARGGAAAFAARRFAKRNSRKKETP